MNRPRLALAAVTLAVLAGCSSSPDETPRAAPAGAAATAATAEASGTPQDSLTDGTPIPTAGWTTADADGAASVAGQAVAVFVYKPEPGPMGEAEWWAELSSWMTSEAQTAYARTDPVNVPGTMVTSPPAAARGDSDYLATAVVPTDAGRYEVLLTRATGAWLVERITPPIQ